MKTGELIVIYLSIGAPFGVAHFLNAGEGRRDSLSLLAAFVTGFLWPWSALRSALQLFRRSAVAGEKSAANNPAEENAQIFSEEINRAWRVFDETLSRAEETLSAAFHPHSAHLTETLACGFRRLRRKTEQHRRLAMALDEAANQSLDETTPEPRGVELCRLAGREGDDLDIAARCLSRRNLKKLRGRVEMSAQEIVHALAELRESLDSAQAGIKPGGVAQLNFSLQHLYSSAIELFSHLDDMPTVLRLSRLLNMQCARVRELSHPITPQLSEPIKASQTPVEIRHSTTASTTTLVRG